MWMCVCVSMWTYPSTPPLPTAHIHEIVERREGDQGGEPQQHHDLERSAPAATVLRVQGAVDGKHRRVSLEEPLWWIFLCIYMCVYQGKLLRGRSRAIIHIHACGWGIVLNWIVVDTRKGQIHILHPPHARLLIYLRVCMEEEAAQQKRHHRAQARPEIDGHERKGKAFPRPQGAPKEE